MLEIAGVIAGVGVAGIARRLFGPNEERRLGAIAQDALYQAQFRAGNVEGHECNRIGTIYFLGTEVTQNYASSFQWFDRAMTLECTVAFRNIGLFYEFGRGIPINVATAAKRYAQAIQRGYGLAQVDLDRLFTSNAINAADAERIALIFHHGDATLGVELLTPNYAEALRWHQKAMVGGSALASRNIGLLFENAQGVPRDVVIAAQHYSRALRGRDVQAQADLDRLRNNVTPAESNRIAAIYYSGQGVEQNYASSFQWFDRAMTLECNVAFKNIGLFYEFGRGIPVNLPTAAKRYAQAIQRGYGLAQADLDRLFASNSINAADAERIALTFHHGDTSLGVELLTPNYAEALRWHQKAMAGGSALASRNIGLLFENAQGVARNAVVATEHYLRAIREGDIQAQAELNRMIGVASVLELSQVLLKTISLECIETTRKLIKLPINLDVQDENLNTPLHLAILNRQFDIAYLLVRARANFSIANHEGHHAFALLDAIPENSYTPAALSLLALMLCINPQREMIGKNPNFRDHILVMRDSILEINSRYRRDSGSMILSRNITTNSINDRIEEHAMEQSFREMFEHPELRPLLKITVFGALGFHDTGGPDFRSLRIVIDPHEENLNQISQRTVPNAVGVFYSGVNARANRIYLAGQQAAREEESRLLTRGTMIHEICHFVMYEVFKNDCNPYLPRDVQNRQRFENICQQLRRHPNAHPIIRTVFEYYPEVDWHRELIVRVPQLIAIRRADLFEQENLRELFTYYHEVVMPACKKHSAQLRENRRIVKVRPANHVQVGAMFERVPAAQNNWGNGGAPTMFRISRNQESGIRNQESGIRNQESEQSPPIRRPEGKI